MSLHVSLLSRLKPVSKLKKSGYLQLSVVGYGGGLWHTWYVAPARVSSFGVRT